jgi:hypothetical protein
MAQNQPASPPRTFPRWSVPLAKVPHRGPPEAIYAALVAGRECHWQAIDRRIILFCRHLVRRGLIDGARETGLMDKLDDINQRLADVAMDPTPRHLEYAFVASLNLTAAQQTDLRAAAAKAGTTCAAFVVKSLVKTGGV